MAKAKGRNGWRKGSIELLPSGRFRWRVRVTLPDGTHDRPDGVARTRTEAQDAINKAQQEAAAGQRPVTKTLTVEQMVREHMDAMRPAWSAALLRSERIPARAAHPAPVRPVVRGRGTAEDPPRTL